MEITGRNDDILLGEDRRVIRRAVDLGFENTAYIVDRIFRRTVYLGNATERIGILHVLLRTGDHLAAFEQATEIASRSKLSLVGTDFMHLVDERVDAAVECVERHRADQVGPLAQATSLDKRIYAESRHELRTVQQGEALLRLQRNRLPAELLEDFVRRTPCTLVLHFAEAQQRQAHVGQRSQVARSAQRSLLEHDRQHVVVEEIDQTLYGFELHARIAVRKGLDLEQQHQLHDLGRNALARTAGMRHHQVLLQLRELVLVDRNIAERTEAGRNTVDGLFLGFHLVIQVFATTHDAFFRIFAQVDFDIVFQNFADTIDRKILRADMMNHRCISY